MGTNLIVSLDFRRSPETGLDECGLITSATGDRICRTIERCGGAYGIVQDYLCLLHENRNLLRKISRPDRLIRELKNHHDDFVDDDWKWDTVHCASAISKFRRRGVVDDAKHSRITSSCNPQASAGISPYF